MERRGTTAAGVLLTAAGLIERLGLARNCWSDADGCICAVRALQLPVLGDTFQVPWWDSGDVEPPVVYQQALRACSTWLGWPSWFSVDQVEDQLTAWSDTLARDVGHVAEMFRGAAALFSADLAGRL